MDVVIRNFVRFGQHDSTLYNIVVIIRRIDTLQYFDNMVLEERSYIDRMIHMFLEESLDMDRTVHMLLHESPYMGHNSIRGP